MAADHPAHKTVGCYSLVKIFGSLFRDIARHGSFFGAAFGSLAAALLGAGVYVVFDAHEHLGGVNVVNLSYGAVCQIGYYSVDYTELQRCGEGGDCFNPFNAQADLCFLSHFVCFFYACVQSYDTKMRDVVLIFTLVNVKNATSCSTECCIL